MPHFKRFPQGVPESGKDGRTDRQHENTMPPANMEKMCSLKHIYKVFWDEQHSSLSLWNGFSPGEYKYCLKFQLLIFRLGSPGWQHIMVYSSWLLKIGRAEQRQVCSQPNCHFGLCNYCCWPTHLRAGKSLNCWGKHYLNKQPHWLKEVKSHGRREASVSPRGHKRSWFYWPRKY